MQKYTDMEDFIQKKQKNWSKFPETCQNIKVAAEKFERTDVKVQVS